ncbi:MAG: hypothetical protein RRA92_04620 [Gemmatimonadota bacterium]|nr:hypothetical protein [Gemmatimonadota bacterium]
MAEPDLSGRADRRTAEAMAAAGLADPRPALRELLRRLRAEDEAAFREASDRYRDRLVPEVADGGTDPLAAWLAYGRDLAGRLAPGDAVAVDATGRARPAEPGTVPGALVLHLPSGGGPAVVLLRPADPSDAQAAAAELLAP